MADHEFLQTPCAEAGQLSQNIEYKTWLPGKEVYSCTYANQYHKDFRSTTMDLYLDDELIERVHFAEHHVQRRIFVMTNLPRGSHALQLVCIGQSMFVDHLRYTRG